MPATIRVAVGMPVARHPPHRSVHDGSPSYGSYLEYLASNRSHGRGCFFPSVVQLGAHQPIYSTPLPGPESGQWAADQCSSWLTSFPPQTPQKKSLPCSPASSVLCCHPTSYPNFVPFCCFRWQIGLFSHSGPCNFNRLSRHKFV